MHEIRLKDFRCFQNEQTARLAPLTLLVGENSTGKTSLMALVRALVKLAGSGLTPDFKEEPYDLGSFEEIAHHRGARGSRVANFAAGFSATQTTTDVGSNGKAGNHETFHFDATFSKQGTAATPSFIRVSNDTAWVELNVKDEEWNVLFGTPTGKWTSKRRFPFRRMLDSRNEMIPPLPYFVPPDHGDPTAVPEEAGPPTEQDREHIENLIASQGNLLGKFLFRPPYASAPVRSKPRRTYDPARPTHDPEGENVPMYLAAMYFQRQSAWAEMKSNLEQFGKAAGLFDEIAIKPLGNRDSEPFQIQIRKYGNKAKGPGRNLIDVGYGVSQVLPVITELLRPDPPSVFLVQQPEVHLHPSAQAALGSLFCRIAAHNRQLIVETHSDHLLDRVRMDVRDNKTPLQPKDVSILYFERLNLDVRIHSLRIDQNGNIVGAPPGYRRFFLEETQRSLGL